MTPTRLSIILPWRDQGREKAYYLPYALSFSLGAILAPEAVSTAAT